MLDNEKRILRGVRFHHLSVVTQDDSTKGPISERLESSNGGGMDILQMPAVARAHLKLIASVHNGYEQRFAKAEDPDLKALYKQDLKRTNQDLPTEVQDPAHNQ